MTYNPNNPNDPNDPNIPNNPNNPNDLKSPNIPNNPNNPNDPNDLKSPNRQSSKYYRPLLLPSTRPRQNQSLEMVPILPCEDVMCPCPISP